MKRFIFATLAVFFVWLGAATGPAAAQNTYPYQQPMFRPGWSTPLSPYLRMLVPGNAAVNYYGLVEPQFRNREYRAVMNQTIQGLINEMPEPPGILLEEELNGPMRATGHPTAFNYTGSYFTTLTGQPMASLGGYGQRAAGGGRMMGMGMGMMRAGMGMGGAGTWPNMRPGMGPMGR